LARKFFPALTSLTLAEKIFSNLSLPNLGVFASDLEP
jgi:hypothetical protein